MERATQEEIYLVDPTTGRRIAPVQTLTSSTPTAFRQSSPGATGGPALVDPTTGKVLPWQPPIQPNTATPGFLDPKPLKRPPSIGEILTDSWVSERNALWTTVQHGFLFSLLDIAVGVDPLGQRFVWIVGDGNRFARLDPGAQKFEHQPMNVPLPSTATRIAAGGNKVVCSTAEGWMLQWPLSEAPAYQVLPLPSGARDVAVSESGQIARVGTKLNPGEVLMQEGGGWRPVMDQHSMPVTDGEGISFGTYAGKTALWVCKSDRSVSIYYPFHAGSSATNIVNVPPAFDVGAYRAGWVLARSAPISKLGYELWKVTPSRARKVLDSGVTAVDVDPDGNPWVVDAKGRIRARGVQVLAFHPVARELPPTPSLNPLDTLAQGEPDYWERWNEVFQLSDELGAAGAVILQPWGLVDPAGVADLKLDDPERQLVEASWERLKGQLRGYVGRGFRLLVNIAPIFTGKLFLPFTADQAVVRYGQFIDRLKAELPGFESRVEYLSVGNEVDVFLCAQPFPYKEQAWAEYKLLFDQTVDMLRAKLPRAKIGVTMTLHGSAMGFGSDFPSLRPEAEALVAKSDVIIFTYYPYWMPVSGDLLEPAQATSAFTAMRALAQKLGKPVVLQEVGYSSAPEVHGLEVNAENIAWAEQRQAQFLAIVLDEWAKSGPAIPFLSWFSLHDHYFNRNWDGQMLRPDGMWNYVEQEGDTGFGSGNLVAPFFLGKPEKLNWLPEGILSWTDEYPVWFSQLFASCGLLAASSEAKPALTILGAWVAAHRR